VTVIVSDIRTFSPGGVDQPGILGSGQSIDDYAGLRSRYTERRN
jgi:hypothetical protein